METIAENKRARFDYTILEIFEAGIELLGFEVKSAKNSRLQLAGSYALIKNGQAWLVNAQIPPYQPGNTPPTYDPTRTRRLLLRREEIESLASKLRGGLTLIPLRAYIKKNLIKIELGLAKSKKKSDKRELLKKRSVEKEMRRTARR